MPYALIYTETFSFDEPGPNQPAGAITVYYRTTPEEGKLLKMFVTEKVEEMTESLKTEIQAGAVFSTELTKHRKVQGGYYTPADIIMDLYQQLDKGHNATKSMIDRWNEVFTGGYQIQAIKDQPKASKMKRTFTKPATDLLDFGDDNDN